MDYTDDTCFVEADSTNIQSDTTFVQTDSSNIQSDSTFVQTDTTTAQSDTIDVIGTPTTPAPAYVQSAVIVEQPNPGPYFEQNPVVLAQSPSHHQHTLPVRKPVASGQNTNHRQSSSPLPYGYFSPDSQGQLQMASPPLQGQPMMQHQQVSEKAQPMSPTPAQPMPHQGIQPQPMQQWGIEPQPKGGGIAPQTLQTPGMQPQQYQQQVHGQPMLVQYSGAGVTYPAPAAKGFSPMVQPMVSPMSPPIAGPFQPSQYQTALPLGALNLGPAPVDCPACHVRGMTRTMNKVGNTNHLWAAALCFLFCIGPIAYLMEGFKDVQHNCSNCGAMLATWHRGGGADVHIHG